MTANTPFTKELVTMHDGVALATYRCGDPRNPALLLSNAYAISSEFWAPVARALSDSFFIVTLETRGHPSLVEEFDAEKCSLATHADDLAAMLEHYGIAEAHVAGWCSGAQVALTFAAAHHQRVRSLALLSGFFCVEGKVPQTEFIRNMTRLMPLIAVSRQRAALYCQMTAQNPDSGGVANLLMHINSEVRDLASAPYREAEALYRYANLAVRMLKEEIFTPPKELHRIPTLVIAGDQDVIAHPELSVVLCEKLPGAKLLRFADMDHYAIYTDERIPEMLREFFHA